MKKHIKSCNCETCSNFLASQKADLLKEIEKAKNEAVDLCKRHYNSQLFNLRQSVLNEVLEKTKEFILDELKGVRERGTLTPAGEVTYKVVEQISQEIIKHIEKLKNK